MCRAAGGVVCGCCVAVHGWRVEGDDAYVEVVGVCGVGRTNNVGWGVLS